MHDEKYKRKTNFFSLFFWSRHWQLCDLIASSNKGPLYNETTVVHYPLDNKIMSLDMKTGRRKSAIDLCFHPTCIAEANGIIATGGVIPNQTFSMSSTGLLTILNSRNGQYANLRLGQYINNSINLYPTESGDIDGLVCNNDHQIYSINIDNTRVSHRGSVQLDNPVNNCCRSPDGKMVVACGDGPEIYIFHNDDFRIRNDQTSPRFTNILTPHDCGFSSDFHSSGLYFCVGFQNGNALVYDVRNLSEPVKNIESTRKCSNDSNNSNGAFRNVKFSDGLCDILAIAEQTSRVHLLDVRNFDVHQVLILPDDPTNKNDVVNRPVIQTYREIMSPVGPHGSGSSTNRSITAEEERLLLTNTLNRGTTRRNRHRESRQRAIVDSMNFSFTSNSFSQDRDRIHSNQQRYNRSSLIPQFTRPTSESWSSLRLRNEAYTVDTPNTTRVNTGTGTRIIHDDRTSHPSERTQAQIRELIEYFSSRGQELQNRMNMNVDNGINSQQRDRDRPRDLDYNEREQVSADFLNFQRLEVDTEVEFEAVGHPLALERHPGTYFDIDEFRSSHWMNRLSRGFNDYDRTENENENGMEDENENESRFALSLLSQTSNPEEILDLINFHRSSLSLHFTGSAETSLSTDELLEYIYMSSNEETEAPTDLIISNSASYDLGFASSDSFGSYSGLNVSGLSFTNNGTKLVVGTQKGIFNWSIDEKSRRSFSDYTIR